MKKKILILLALLVAMTLVFVACKDDPQPPVDDTTVADQPTEEPTQGEEDPTEAPDTDPETPEPGTDEPDEPTTPAPETDPETPAPETQAPETPEPETADPMEPVNVFGAEDIQTVTGGDPNNMTQDCLTLEEGYIHVVPLGPDPYWYPFAGVDGARYVAIRYRTDATGADMQLYMSSTGNGPQDDTTMIRQPVIADGEWHVIIFDTQSLIDANLYDGEYVSYFRFDPLEAGYKLDENGQPYKEESGQWARYSLPEGCMIDIAYIGFFHCEEAVAKYDFEQYPPYAQPGESGLKNVSFDTFYLNNQMYFPEDGGADAKLDAINNTLVFNAASELESIILRGWIGFDQPIDTFGYYVDNYEFVYGDYKKPTEDGVLAAGGEHATRFDIFVDLSYLEGDDHFVGFVAKLADGTIVQLREDITIDLPELPKDITDSFIADVNANEVGTTMDATDLGNFFVTELPLPGSGVEANGEGKLYHLTSINDMYADVNGKYFFKANVINSDGAGWMFARGYKVVNSDAIIEAFDPAGGFYKINNYYETDSAGAMGGAGIYARLGGGKLFIMVKYYNPDTITRVGNKIYAIDAAGTELTLADNGSTVSVLVDGVTYATVELSGSIAYGDINEVDPAGEFAEKAVITLKDGTTETIENTLIAATCECQVGIVARAGSFKFDALAVGGYSAIEVPALEIETPEEPEEPVDPDAPVLVLDPEYINELAGSTEQTVAQHIGSHEIITEDGVTFVRLTSNGGDPYVAIVKLGSYLELPPYMAFAYRTNCDLDAHVFIGSGSGWNGNGDVASVAWNQDNNWNLAVLDLNNAGLTSIQGGIISYCRFDFFTGNGVGNMDVEYVAFFNSAEAAQKYFDKLHGGADEPEHQHEYTTVVTDPTCTEGGYTTYTCACGDSYVADETPAAGHNFVDGFCGICGEADPDYVAPVTMPAEFVLNMYQANRGETLYFTGAMSGYYLATSTNPADAVKMYSEAVEGGYRMYFYDGDTKTYVDIVYRDATKANVILTTTPTGIFVWNEEAGTWTVTVADNGKTFYLGTYNSFATFSTSNISYITGDNAANVGVTQFLAQWADVPAPHEHNYEYETIVIDPTCTEDGYTVHKCECGDGYIDTEIPAAGHNFVDGFCGICGEADPDAETPDEPDAPVAGGSADFNTIVTPNANGDSSYKNTYTTENGWVSENSAIQAGGANNSNPQYTVIGPDNSYKAICMNGKVGVAGKITSPTLSGGISKLVLTYTKMFTDTKLSVTITITDLATGATYTRTVARDVDKDTDKYVVWTDEWVLETPITGDFTIELVNDCPSNNTSSNKDRITILSITWEGAAAEEPETPDEPAANEIPVTTTDNYTWMDVVEFTATVSGTYTFTLPAGLGAFDVTACDTWPPVPGTAPYVDYYDNAEGATFSIELAAGETTRFYIGSTTKADWVITWTVAEGEVGGGEEPDPEEPTVEDVVLVVGDNEINVTEDMKAQGGFNATITVDADGDYKFSSNYLLVRIYNEMGIMMGTGSAYLTAGTYNLEIVTAFAPGAGVFGINVEFLAPVDPEPDPDPEQPEDAVSFPYELTVDGSHDIYFNFAPAEDCVVKITYTAGNFVSGLTDYDRNTEECYYIARFVGGQVYEINPWGSSAGTYTFEYYVEEPEVVENYLVPQDIWTVSGHCH